MALSYLWANFKPISDRQVFKFVYQVQDLLVQRSVSTSPTHRPVFDLSSGLGHVKWGGSSRLASILPYARFRRNDHREDASRFLRQRLIKIGPNEIEALQKSNLPIYSPNGYATLSSLISISCVSNSISIKNMVMSSGTLCRFLMMNSARSFASRY